MQFLRKFFILVTTFVLTCCFSNSAFAFYQRFVNLGITNFLDGLPLPNGPGFYLLGNVTTYNAYQFVGPTGMNLPLTQINTLAFLPHVLYQTDLSVLKGQLGFSVLPIYVSNIHLSQNQLHLQSSGPGWDDLVVGPYIQWQPITLDGHPFMANRVEIDFFAPIGKFHAEDQINPGAHIFSVEPYWASTVLLSQNWDISWRLHYLFNTQNDMDGINPGDAFHANFSTSYAILPPKFRIGVAGYYFKQTQDSKIYGRDIPNSEEQVLGIGPGAVYAMSKKTTFFLNTYFESDVRNRPVGSRVVLSVLHYFY